MGLFSSPKNKLEKWAVPFAQQGLANAQNVFNQNQPGLNDLAGKASDAFSTVAPKAYGENPFLDNAKGAARTISNGFFLGQNPGQGTYDRLQGGGLATNSIRSNDTNMIGGGGRPLSQSRIPVGGPTNPAMGLLGGMATDNSPTAGTSLITGSANGANPGNQFAEATAQGAYLNRQPSSGLYGEMMDRSYSTSNPFLDDIIRQNDENVSTQAARLFGSRGMGAGIGSAYADVVSRNLADTGGQLRYQNYNDAENRRLQAGGQSDAAFANERGNMMAGAGLLSSNFNSGMDRMLSAGQALGQNDLASGAQRLSAAQSLGDQFNAGADRGLDRYRIDSGLYDSAQDRSLEAAKAADASQNTSIAQILQSLGLTGQLEASGYAGYEPTTDLLKTAATLPYLGLDSYGSTLANILGQSRKQTGGGIGGQLLGAGAQLGSAAIMASDRRLKKNIEKAGELRDGLGLYHFEYIDGERFGSGRFKGVMADEVAALRPWALGSTIDGEYASVDYSKLEAA